MEKFIGRINEMKTLETEYRRDSSFVVIYGRRRVGKTTLMKEFIKGKNALYFLATEEIESQSQKRLLNLAAGFSRQDYLKTASVNDWEAIFQVIANSRPDEKKVLVIDEFQYLVQVNTAFPSILQKIWDEFLKDKKIMVILCGSLISMMLTHVLSYSSPLYGRRTAQIRLQPLKFTDLQDRAQTKSFSEWVEFHALTGGVPKYFEFFDNDHSIMENIRAFVLNKSGFLYEEPLFLLESEVREPVNYFSIIKTIAEGNHKSSEISNALLQKANNLSPYLSTLMDLDLIEKRIPVTEKTPEKSRKGLYFIKDNFINFWFNYVYPDKGELELDNQEIVMKKLEDNFADRFVSYVYEDVCKDIFSQLCKDGAIAFTPSKIGSYWNGNSTIEIDVVAMDNTRHMIFAAECKYLKNKPLDFSVYLRLLEKCSTPDFSGYDIMYGLFSKSGFDKRLMDLAKVNANLVLINEWTICT